MMAAAPAALAQSRTSAYKSDDDTFLALRDASRADDAGRAFDLAARLSNYPIRSYVDYYRIKPRLRTQPVGEIRDFLRRYEGTAIADRLRNDWLLELGRTRDWATFDEQYPQFVLDDDTQLKCYALMSRLAKNQNVIADAHNLLISPKDYGEGCAALITAMAGAGQFNSEDIWFQIRLAAEFNQPALARRLALLTDVPENSLLVALDKPAQMLTRGILTGSAMHEAFIIAVGRMAKTNIDQAGSLLLGASQRMTPLELAAGWSQIALQASLKLMPEANEYWRRSGVTPLSTEGYQWRVRSALRAGDWAMVKSGIDAMPPALRQDPTWVYWLGRAYQAQGRNEEAQAQFQKIANQTHFYGQLALEEQGRKIVVPPRPVAPTASEIAEMGNNAGFRNAFKFLDLNLRFESNREWNWQVRHMTERQQFAAAEFARQNNLLDRMVYTSDRTKNEFDFTQRYPSPFGDVMQNATQQLGLDRAWVYGLIRQESRFVQVARSSVGASGLMQLMPGTAREVARKIGLTGFSQNQVNDINTNILLGTNYLNMVLNSLDGSQALATAAYNAGPGRPKAWRSTLTRPVEGAIFAESIPFAETRGYVKHVLSNATYYAAQFENAPQSLKARLGTVAPKTFIGAASPDPF